MKRKGFTLIELLAVIVILAVIALIAVPMVLNTIDDAKKGAAKASASNYLHGLETSLISERINGNAISNGLYTIDANGIVVGSETLEVSIKGDKATEGKVCINSQGEVSAYSLKVGNYYITSTDGTTQEITDELEEIDCDGEEIAVLGNSILDKTKALVYDKSGICKTDGSTYNYMGGCYIKGASTNNYVWYNGFMWRIMGINSDSTVRLITDENVTGLAYGALNKGLTYTTNEGYIHDWLNEYFYEHLNNTKNIIQEGAYFCSESTNGTFLTTGRTTCTSGNEVTAKVGIIAIDEYLLANTSSSYLNIGQIFWTMTPHNASNIWRSGADYIDVDYAYGIRPVINVNSSATITSGDGTSSSFYVLEEDKLIDITGTIGEKTTSGEYVSLEGKVYRIVSKDSTGVKIILDSFYQEKSGTNYEMQYNETAGNNTFTLESGIGAKLNGDVLTWLGLSSSDKIIISTWYQSDGYGNGSPYTAMLNKTNGVNAKVGLIRVGEMLANQSSTMLTKNYTTTGISKNVTHYWTMNKCESSAHIWEVRNSGYVAGYGLTSTRGVRPVIVVRSDLNINGGNGTWISPYEI